MRIFSYIILIIVLLFGITFACLNHAPVTIDFFIGEKSIALSLLLVIAFAIGGLLGILAGFVMMIKLKASNMQLRRQIKKLES